MTGTETIDRLRFIFVYMKFGKLPDEFEIRQNLGAGTDTETSPLARKTRTNFRRVLQIYEKNSESCPDIGKHERNGNISDL